jgi:hypothetical protein
MRPDGDTTPFISFIQSGTRRRKLFPEVKKTPEIGGGFLIISATGWHNAGCVVAPLALRPYFSIGMPLFLFLINIELKSIIFDIFIQISTISC